MFGEIAEAGGDFTVVSVLPLVVTVLFVVESVTIVSEKTIDENITKRNVEKTLIITMLQH
jgi:hypothetical protein